MCAGDRGQREDQRHQRGSGGDRIGEQRQADIAWAQPFGHDAGADDGHQQKRRADKFDRRAGTQSKFHWLKFIQKRSLPPDIVDLFLEREAIEGREREAQEQADSAVQQKESLAEGLR